MRITTGRFKGRTINTVHDLSVRPATDRVRQSLFNILAHRIPLDGITVLDLFAGSGSLGFESLSRGTGHVTFVDNDPRVVRLLESTARTLGCEQAVTIIREEASRYLFRASDTWTVIFASPPYGWPDTALIPETVFRRNLVSPGGLLLIEHARGLLFSPSSVYRQDDQRTYGRTVVTMFHRTAESGTDETTDRGIPGDV